MTAPGVVSDSVTDTAALEVPGAGLKVGFAATGDALPTGVASMASTTTWRIAGQCDAFDRLRTVDRKGVAVQVERSVIGAPASGDPVWHRQYRGFSGIVLRREPVAQALRKAGRGSIRVGHDKCLVDLRTIDTGTQ